MDSKLFEKNTHQYPDRIRSKLAELKALILKTANELELSKVEESIKWGELSYSVKHGSPIRIDWKEQFNDSVFIYFNCNTKLVETFRELYPKQLILHGNRGLELKVEESWPERVICHCIELALRYHRLKNMSLLGAVPKV